MKLQVSVHPSEPRLPVIWLLLPHLVRFRIEIRSIGIERDCGVAIGWVNVQRGGPSQQGPTKTEQADLLQTLYGRNSESPVVVVAAYSLRLFPLCLYVGKNCPGRNRACCAAHGWLSGNGTEPWKVPTMAELPSITPRIAKDVSNSNHTSVIQKLWRASGPSPAWMVFTPGWRTRKGCCACQS